MCFNDPSTSSEVLMKPLVNRPPASIQFTIVALFSLLCGGCGAANLPGLGFVSGTVTLDGQPLENVLVSFAPENGRPSTGITDSSGNYELNYIRDTKGAIPGTHRVRITTLQEAPSDQDPTAAVQEKIPAKYNVNTTLTAEVNADENTFDFALESN